MAADRGNGSLAPLTQYDIESVPDFDGFEHRPQHLEGHVFYPIWWDPEHRVCSYDEDLTETIPANLALARRAADIVSRRMGQPRR